MPSQRPRALCCAAVVLGLSLVARRNPTGSVSQHRPLTSAEVYSVFIAFGQGVLRKVKICEKYTLKKNLFRKQFQSKCSMR